MTDPTLTRGARWSVAGLLALTILVGAGNLWATYDQVGAVRAASARASAASATTAQLCEASNVARAQQIGLWEYLIHLTGPPKDAQGAALLARFDHHLHVVFAQRDCHRMGG